MKENSRKAKIKIIGIVVLALVIVATVGVTIALYTSQTNEVVNHFTLGNVTTEVIEDFHDNGDNTFTKTPQVVNTGANDCLVRIRVSVTPATLPENYLTVDYKTGDSDDWYLKDGYYYYKKVLKPGETTSPLFTTVAVNKDMDWIDFDIILYHESVQASIDGTDLDANKNWKYTSEIWKFYENLKKQDNE